MSTIQTFFFRLFNPKFWVMLNEYSKWHDLMIVDKVANKSEWRLDSINPIDGKIYYIIHEDGTRLWVQNYPYGYGWPWNPLIKSIRPSRTTILRLRRLELKLAFSKLRAKQKTDENPT